MIIKITKLNSWTYKAESTIEQGRLWGEGTSIPGALRSLATIMEDWALVRLQKSLMEPKEQKGPCE